MRFFHRKSNRLNSEKEIEELFSDGKSHFIYPIKLVYARTETQDSDYKVLVSVSKRNIKSAVFRNVIKRRLKEAFRLNSENLQNSLSKKGVRINLAFIYVSSKLISYNEIEELVIKQIQYLTNVIDRIEK
ncbi:MAG: ribonuclease P protein component [Tenuifilaceae bacterium]